MGSTVEGEGLRVEMKDSYKVMQEQGRVQYQMPDQIVHSTCSATQVREIIRKHAVLGGVMIWLRWVNNDFMTEPA